MPVTITKAQLQELTRLRQAAEALAEALKSLESQIYTKDVREHLVRTAKPSPEKVAHVTARLRAKGVIK